MKTNRRVFLKTMGAGTLGLGMVPVFQLTSCASKTKDNDLLTFMITGDPNVEGLPKWPVYTKENGEIMILNDTCEVRNDPDREGRKLL
ncbi:MAG: hypothetical protein GX126_02190 [Bacteroidales bacterium]|jgi:carboxylesterase type B|nr:hypothetical protein [Bacteroidales bacterium]NLY24552.1 hypothetical protein [Bacteroidales bacterium]